MDLFFVLEHSLPMKSAIEFDKDIKKTFSLQNILWIFISFIISFSLLLFLLLFLFVLCICKNGGKKIGVDDKKYTTKNTVNLSLFSFPKKIIHNNKIRLFSSLMESNFLFCFVFVLRIKKEKERNKLEAKNL